MNQPPEAPRPDDMLPEDALGQDTAPEDTLQALPTLAVSRTGGLPPGLVVAGFTLLAVGLFGVLNGRREQAEARTIVTPPPNAASSMAAPPLALPANLLQAPPAPPPPAPTPPPPPPPEPPAAPAGPDPAIQAARQRLAAPAVVVDFDTASRPIQLAQADRPASSPATAADISPGAAMVQALQGDDAAGGVEAMADRLQVGRSTPGAAVATRMGDLTLTIPQGAVIPAVLETAIDSDLPGYARAVVSRDVRGFNGEAVLIPRGSRLIGQYRSALALGQSRAFVIWSRVIRPDGVTVQIGSPGTDELGRGGLTGKVDRHFLTRFGGSILLSVLNAGVASIGDGPTTTIAIGSPGDAGAAVDAVKSGAVPPTIRVPQGEAIRIFVARDLDFSTVGPAR